MTSSVYCENDSVISASSGECPSTKRNIREISSDSTCSSGVEQHDGTETTKCRRDDTRRVNVSRSDVEASDSGGVASLHSVNTRSTDDRVVQEIGQMRHTIKLCSSLQLFDEYHVRLMQDDRYRQLAQVANFTALDGEHTINDAVAELERLLEHHNALLQGVLPLLRSWLFKVRCLECWLLDAWWCDMRIEVARCALIALLLEEMRLLVKHSSLTEHFIPRYVMDIFEHYSDSEISRQHIVRIFTS